jgi:hypothetical protein
MIDAISGSDYWFASCSKNQVQKKVSSELLVGMLSKKLLVIKNK